MGRDIQFEIQYLLALTLVVFGLSSVEIFGAVIDPRVGYLFILFLAIHLSLFNLYYAYGEALDYSIDFVDRMNERSGLSLFATTISFTYVVLHWITSLTLDLIVADSVQFQYRRAGEIFIDYLAPLLIIALMGYSFNEKVKGPHDRFRDINIKIFPQEVRVFSTRRDSKPFSVKIENLGDDPFPYKIQIPIPEGVTLYRGDDVSEEEFLESGTVSPERQEKSTFELSYAGDQRQPAEIDVTVHFDGGHKTETIAADLVPQ